MGNLSQRDARRLTAAEKAKRAAELRAQGMTLEEIARQVGYSNRGTVHAVLRDRMSKLPALATAELRAALDAKLDRAERRTTPLLDHEDPQVRLRAADVIGRLVQKRAEILGLPRLVDMRVEHPQPAMASPNLDALSVAEIVVLQLIQAIVSGARPNNRELVSAAQEWLAEISTPVALPALPPRAELGAVVAEVVDAADDDL